MEYYSKRHAQRVRQQLYRAFGRNLVAIMVVVLVLLLIFSITQD